MRGHRRPPIRSRVPLHRRARLDPAGLRSWLLIAVAAALVTTLVARTVGEAEAARHRWGSTVEVLVATRPVASGAALSAAVAPAPWPRALLPEGAVRSVPREARASHAVAAGAPITAEAVAGPRRRSGRRPDRRRVPVPVGEARLVLRPGDRVDVWATVDPSLAGGRLTTRRVATAARVVRPGARAVELAVRPVEVAAVAEAATTATVTLVAAA